MAAISRTKSINEFRSLQVYEGTFDLASVAGASVAEQDITVTGLLATDMLISLTCTDTGTIGIGGARVKAADTLSVLCVNPTASPIDPAGTLNYRLIIAPAI